jgi:prolyl-tRNA synthetase
VAVPAAAGLQPLLGDRDQRPGGTIKDAALRGRAGRVTVGARALARGCVEVKARRATEAAEVPVGEVAARVAALLDAGSAA